jgi:apolipoprotein N-acyltransferase
VAFPPADAGWVAFVALIPVVLFLREAEWKPAIFGGLAFSLVFFGLLLSWITLFGAPAYAVLVSRETIWILITVHAAVTCRKNLPERWGFIAIPVVFLAGEWLRGHLLAGGFTWGGLGYSQHDNIPLLHIAAYAGVWGVSFLVVLINALLAEGARLVFGWRRTVGEGRLRGFVLIGSALALLFLPQLLPVGQPEGPRARVAMVQGNVALDEGDYPTVESETILNNHAALTSRLSKGEVDLVIWPESSLDRDPMKDPTALTTIRESIRSAGAPLVLGTSIEVGSTKFRNVSLFFDATGRMRGSYDKIHLVPYGEYVPGRRILVPLIKQLALVPRDGIPGKKTVVFSMSKGKFASVICFESIFPGLVRRFVSDGARLLVVSTNNSSFERSAASEQHVAFSQLRAAEHRMWIAHTALSGISAVVAPDGRVLQRTPLFVQALLTPQVRFATHLTFYGKYGDWLPILALVSVLVMLLLPLYQVIARRTKSQT